MKSDCEDYSKEERAVSMKFNCPGGPNISQEAHKWLNQAERELCYLDTQLKMVIEVLCHSTEDHTSIDSIRNTYVDMCVSSGGDAEYVKEQAMWYLPDVIENCHRLPIN